MDKFLIFTIVGLSTAAIYAVIGSGLVLTYTTTGVFNLAHGAMGMVAAFCYFEMRFAWHWPAPIALIVCILILAPAFGALLEIGIMRRLEGTSETTKLVVSLSLLLGLYALALWVWDPLKSRPMRKFWEGKVFVVFNVRLPYHQVTALALALLVALGMRLLLYRTRSGVAMRAAVDDRSLAMLNGARPVRSAMLAWAIGASLAALAGVLIAPTITLSAHDLALLIINAYAAAMIGRLRSLPWTFIGALILGLANDLGRGYLSKITTGQQYLQGFLFSIPIIILFIVLLILPQAQLRGRAIRAREVARMPTWRGALMMSGLMVAAAAMLSVVLHKADLINISSMWGFAIIGLSMIPLIGYAGQISLCQLSFAGIGMVVVAHLGGQGNPLALVWAVIITGLVGAIVALPALRLQGIYLALSTAAFAVAMDRWIFPLPKFTIFGHNFNLSQAQSLAVNRPRFFGLRLQGPKAYYIFGAIVFAILCLLVVAIRRGTFGQRLLAMKESPAACATLGLNLTFTKMAVFAISAAMAGLGGAIYGGALRTADPTLLEFFAGLPILLVMVIAGLNTTGGALFAGIALGVIATLIPNLFSSLKQVFPLAVGFAGIGLGKNPNGFITNDIRPNWEAFLHDPPALIGVIAAEVLAWVLRVVHAYANWPYTVLALGILVLAPGVRNQLRARRPLAAPVTAATPAMAGSGSASPGTANGAAHGDQLSGPIEWLGILQPFQPGDVALLDARLALPEVGPRGTA